MPVCAFFERGACEELQQLSQPVSQSVSEWGAGWGAAPVSPPPPPQLMKANQRRWAQRLAAERRFRRRRRRSLVWVWVRKWKWKWKCPPRTPLRPRRCPPPALLSACRRVLMSAAEIHWYCGKAGARAAHPPPPPAPPTHTSPPFPSSYQQPGALPPRGGKTRAASQWRAGWGRPSIGCEDPYRHVVHNEEWKPEMLLFHTWGRGEKRKKLDYPTVDSLIRSLLLRMSYFFIFCSQFKNNLNQKLWKSCCFFAHLENVREWCRFGRRVDVNDSVFMI